MTMPHLPRRQLLLALSAGLLAACATPLRPTMAYLDGSVFYLPRIMWPKDKTLLRVRLLARSDDDAAATIIAEQILEQVSFPASFSLCYDPKALKPGLRYSVDARLFIAGELKMQSTQPYPVLDGKTGKPNIQLDMIGQ